MTSNLEELKAWLPEIADLAQATRDAAASHAGSADFYRSLIRVSSWEGCGAPAALSAMEASAGSQGNAELLMICRAGHGYDGGIRRPDHNVRELS